MRALLLLLLLAGTARADRTHEAFYGAHVRALHTPSANALTDESLAGPAFGYAYRLPLHVLPKLELWGTANVLFGFAQGEMFRTLTTDMWSLQMTGGVRARYALWRRFVAATARFDLGAQRVRLTLEDMADHTASDAGWGALSTAAIGVDLDPISTRRLALGVRVELGYVFAQGIGMTAKSKGAPDDTIELDRMAASLGHLDLGGRYVSFTLNTRF